MPLEAEDTLKKANFFLGQARSSGVADRDAFIANLEVAIIYSRSVTFHLQKELTHNPDFADWYVPQHERLSGCPLSKYLLEQRNYVLKQRGLQVRRVIGISAADSIGLTATVDITVIRGAPWYKRSPRTLYEDAIYPLRAWLGRRRQRRHTQASAIEKRNQHRKSPTNRDDLYFDEEKWSTIPAVDLVQKNLDLLSEIVMEADEYFERSN